MDELKLNLTSPLMRCFVKSLISKAVRDKVGYEIDIDLKNVTVVVEDGKTRLHIEADAEASTKEFFKIIKTIGLN